jgi:putative Holliday junction resolvase
MTDVVPRQGRLAGVDYGTVRIGIAICDPGQAFSSPYENYTRRTTALDGDYFRRLAKEESLVGFVLGLPLHTTGNESQKSREARQFADWLRATTGLPVQRCDERFTSAQAEQHLLAAELTKKRRKERLDMLAAQILLASFLESASREIDRRPLDDASSG